MAENSFPQLAGYLVPRCDRLSRPPIWRFIAVLKMAKTSEKTAKEKTLDRSLYLFEHVFRVLPFHLGSCPLLNPQQAYKSFPELKDYMGTPL